MLGFYLGFPQYENEEFWAYVDRLMQFLDSLDDNGFSEHEMRLTIEKGLNCQVRSLFDSLCDGDLSSKSDEEAFNLFDWLNNESRKPNFSLSLSIEENIIVDVGVSLEALSDDVGGDESVIVVDDLLDDSCISHDMSIDECEFEAMLFHDDYELGESSDTLVMDEVEQFGICEYESISFEVHHEMEELSKECFEESDIFIDSWERESMHTFDDSLEVKWDDDIVDDSLGKPILESFLEDVSVTSHILKDDSLIPIVLPLLDLFTPSYEYMIEKDECDNHFKEVVFSPYLILDGSIIVPFDHPPPIKEEMFYIVDFELDAKNDQKGQKWKKHNILSYFDRFEALSGLVFRLWDPG